MTGVIHRIRRWYGARPLHLLALIAAFALAGYAVHAVAAAGQLRGFALWFGAAIVGHDLLLFPLYSIADLSLRRLLPRWAAGPARPARDADTAAAPAPAIPPPINHVRVPAGFSLLLLLVWFPLILRLSSVPYNDASGLSTSPYLWRWLAVTGVVFLASAVSYALRLRRAAPRTQRGRIAGREPFGQPARPDTVLASRRAGRVLPRRRAVLAGVPREEVRVSESGAACAFCAIVRGEAQAEVIHQTEHLIAFLDHRPLFHGHTLLIPKRHVRLLSDLPAQCVPEFFRTAQRLERAVEDGLSADGSMILINNVVSQSVPHLHLHVIPRRRKDGLRFWLGPRRRYDAEHPAGEYAAKIRSALAAAG